MCAASSRTASVTPITDAPGWTRALFHEDVLYTTQELAAILKVSDSTVRRWRMTWRGSSTIERRGPEPKRMTDRTYRYLGIHVIVWLDELTDPFDAA